MRRKKANKSWTFHIERDYPNEISQTLRGRIVNELLKYKLYVPNDIFTGWSIPLALNEYPNVILEQLLGEYFNITHKACADLSENGLRETPEITLMRMTECTAIIKTGIRKGMGCRNYVPTSVVDFCLTHLPKNK